MFRTARITFADQNGARTITAQVFHDPAYDQFWQDDAVLDAVGRNCDTYGEVGIIDYTWLD